MSAQTSTVIRPDAAAPAGSAVGVRGARRRLGFSLARLSFISPWVIRFRERADPIVHSVWSRIRPVATVVSPVGWVTLAVGVTAIGISAIWSWLEFVFIGATLIAAVVISLAFVAGRSTYRASIELEPLRVVVGERAMGRVSVENIGKRSLMPSRVEMVVGAAVAEFGIPGLSPGEETDDLFAIPTARRAVIVAGPAVAVRGDQLGLLRRTVKCADAVELFVHPRTMRLAPSAAGLMHDLEGHVTRKLSNSDMSFHAIRPYVAGDDQRHVHWKTSARTGQLMVRQFEETKRSQLTIVHSADERYYANEHEFELAISVTASIASHVIRAGNEIAVVTERHDLSTRSSVRLLDDSCRIEPVKSTFATARGFARERTKRLPSPTVLIFVVGSQAPLSDLRSMHSLFGADVRSFAFRTVAGAPPTVSSIPGLAVGSIGSLDDLPGLIRAVSRS